MTTPTPPTPHRARQRSHLANQVAVHLQQRERLVEELERTQTAVDAARLRLEDHDANTAALKALLDGLEAR